MISRLPSYLEQPSKNPKDLPSDLGKTPDIQLPRSTPVETNE